MPHASGELEINSDETGLPPALSNSWLALIDQYLPLTDSGSLWRYSRRPTKDFPPQGWKIHVSATVISAPAILDIIGPILHNHAVGFKAPASLPILMRLNSGIFYGYPQVGKIFTIYPRNDVEFVLLVKELAPPLYRWKSGPSVPFDLRFQDTCIYYRYGAFKSPDPQKARCDLPSITSPDGSVVPDRRDVLSTDLSWLKDPLGGSVTRQDSVKPNPFRGRYSVHRALSQRGKGGVYEALDLSHCPPRTCILKEGRRYGEVTWDGRDGYWRVDNEARVLSALSVYPHFFPKVRDQFDVYGHRYLVIDHVGGTNLDSLIRQKRSDLTFQSVADIALRLCRIVAAIHGAGWIWRDCKTRNFMIDVRGNIKAVDLEGACRIANPDKLPWSTPSFAPSIEQPSAEPTSPAFDLFGLGVCLFQLLEGSLPESREGQLSCRFTRMEIPGEIRKVVSHLLNPNPSDRPPADCVAEYFADLYREGS